MSPFHKLISFKKRRLCGVCSTKAREMVQQSYLRNNNDPTSFTAIKLQWNGQTVPTHVKWQLEK